MFHECYTSTHDRCTENVRIDTVTYSLTLKRSAAQDCDWSIPRSSFVAPSFVLRHCEQLSLTIMSATGVSMQKQRESA